MMVILEKVNGSPVTQIVNQGNQYRIEDVLFYDRNGIQYAQDVRNLKVKLKGESIFTIHIGQFFSKAKVKRKENFKNKEIFIMKNQENLWDDYYDLYIPLDLFPIVQKTKKITSFQSQDDKDEGFYKDLKITYVFDGNQLLEDLSLEFTENRMNNIFLKEVWKKEKQKYFSDFHTKKEKLKELKEHLINTNSDEEVNEQIKPSLFKLAKEIETIVKNERGEALLVYDENDKEEIITFTLYQKKNINEHKVFRDDYPTLMQFCYYMILGLEMQLIELEYYSLTGNFAEHNSPENVKVI